VEQADCTRARRDIRGEGRRVGVGERLLGGRGEEKRPARGPDGRSTLCREIAGILDDDEPVAVERNRLDIEQAAPEGEHSLFEPALQSFRNGHHAWSMHTSAVR
jgi:hypothetical protein